MNIQHCGDIKIFGRVTVGPKGQIVIPKDIRDILHISPGQKFIAVLKENKYIGLVSSEDSDFKKYMDNFMEHV